MVRNTYFRFVRFHHSHHVELFQINRTTYDRVRGWFDQLDTQRRTLISRQLENYPICDDVTQSERKRFVLSLSRIFRFHFKLMVLRGLGSC